MSMLRTKTRYYATPWGIRRVKVWKLGPFVVWRKFLHDSAGAA